MKLLCDLPKLALATILTTATVAHAALLEIEVSVPQAGHAISGTPLGSELLPFAIKYDYVVAVGLKYSFDEANLTTIASSEQTTYPSGAWDRIETIEYRSNSLQTGVEVDIVRYDEKTLNVTTEHFAFAGPVSLFGSTITNSTSPDTTLGSDFFISFEKDDLEIGAFASSSISYNPRDNTPTGLLSGVAGVVVSIEDNSGLFYTDSGGDISFNKVTDNTSFTLSSFALFGLFVFSRFRRK